MTKARTTDRPRHISIKSNQVKCARVGLRPIEIHAILKSEGVRVSHPDRDALLASVYDELRRAAARMLGRERNYLTLQATELVNEAAMRVMQLDRMEWADRRHMFATASRLLRQAMIDAIRKRRAGKRQLPHVTLGAPDEGPPVDIDLLDGALTRLEAISPELAQVVEQRYFVGLSIPEIAAVSGQSERTISRRWQTARAWLSQELGG